MSTAYLSGESREQELLLPARVEDYVGENCHARVIDAFVDGLITGEEEGALPRLREMDGEGGRRGYHPADLARLLIWGYVNRVRSTRQLETDAKRNLEVVWLLRGLTPDHSSISRFRKEMLPEKPGQEEGAGEAERAEATGETGRTEAAGEVGAADATNTVGAVGAVGGEAEVEGPRPRHVLADGAFFDIDDLHECERMGWTPWVPPRKERDEEHGHAKGYRKEDFAYDSERDVHRCPEKHDLTRHSDYRTKAGAVYRTYYDTGACRKCPVRETCCKGGSGYRKIHRHEHQESVERIRERQALEPLRYQRRAASVEHPFGSMMFWNEGRALLCRGEEMAGAEFSLSALAYNLKRAVAEVGVQRLVEALRARMRRFSALLGAFRTPGALPRRPGRPAGNFPVDFAGPAAPFSPARRRDPRPPAMPLMAA